MLKGKLTYLTAAAMIAYGVVGLVFNLGDAQVNQAIIMNGIGLFGLRRAL